MSTDNEAPGKPHTPTVEDEAELLSRLYEYDQWQVHPNGLVACVGCFCVFVPGFAAGELLRYEQVGGGHHDCACHFTVYAERVV